jgi:hypothetical protein
LADSFRAPAVPTPTISEEDVRIAHVAIAY